MNSIIKGRGAQTNIRGRFDTDEREADLDYLESARDEEQPATRTVVKMFQAKSIIARNTSPDIPFDQSINPYQGCEHGCSYCYARPSHSYLGLSPGLDFETQIFVKSNAGKLLRAELNAPGYVCKSITLGANTDPYQPIERDARITRSVIEELQRASHPFSIITKNALIERDLDILAPMAARGLVKVYLSVTSLDNELSRRLEPRASAPLRRIQAISRLAQAGVPVGVVVAPIIPFLTDEFVEAIIERAAHAGASGAGYVMLRLPHEVAPLFRSWIETHYPLKARHVMSIVNQMRGGQDYDSRWGVRQRGTGVFAELIAKRFKMAAVRFGLDRPRTELDCTQFVRPCMAGQASFGF